jgi:hypothetical protein
MTTEEIMDLIYVAIAGLLWLAIYGLARGCMRLQQTGGRS